MQLPHGADAGEDLIVQSDPAGERAPVERLIDQEEERHRFLEELRQRYEELLPRSFDPGNKRTWPPWMRDWMICSGRFHQGPYPGSRSKLWAEVKAGRIPRPTKPSPKIAVWHREVVAQIVEKLAADTAANT